METSTKVSSTLMHIKLSNAAHFHWARNRSSSRLIYYVNTIRKKNPKTFHQMDFYYLLFCLISLHCRFCKLHNDGHIDTSSALLVGKLIDIRGDDFIDSIYREFNPTEVKRGSLYYSRISLTLYSFMFTTSIDFK